MCLARAGRIFAVMWWNAVIVSGYPEGLGNPNGHQVPPEQPGVEEVVSRQVVPRRPSTPPHECRGSRDTEDLRKGCAANDSPKIRS